MGGVAIGTYDILVKLNNALVSLWTVQLLEIFPESYVNDIFYPPSCLGFTIAATIILKRAVLLNPAHLERLGAVVASPNGVSGCQDGGPGVEGGLDPGLGDGDGLLLHSLVDGHLVTLVHLVKLVNAAHTLDGGEGEGGRGGGEGGRREEGGGRVCVHTYVAENRLTL